jgi:hypothetical protein
VLIGLPLVGIVLAGKPLSLYLEFPPVTRYVDHPAFSWAAFLALTLFITVITVPFLVRILRSKAPLCADPTLRRGFPLWGWLGLGIVGVAWVVAWTRFAWFQGLQPFTFSPLWIGYILVVNALTFRRTGSCLMLGRPRYFLALFPLSALLWWFFEYLNRFVQNWYYVGVSNFSPWEYVVYATLPFSTVLPAVLSSLEWLKSFPRLNAAFRNLWPVRIRRRKAVGWAGLIVASAGLMGIGIWPDHLYPLLWVSPLIIITSGQVVIGEPTVFSTVSEGDWRPVWLPALAGLLCGFFWEMWNAYSLAHWEYAIPRVHRFLIFEMPLLGYAGYLPFGLECKVIADLLPGELSASASRGSE